MWYVQADDDDDLLQYYLNRDFDGSHIKKLEPDVKASFTFENPNDGEAMANMLRYLNDTAGHAPVTRPGLPRRPPVHSVPLPGATPDVASKVSFQETINKLLLLNAAQAGIFRGPLQQWSDKPDNNTNTKSPNRLHRRTSSSSAGPFSATVNTLQPMHRSVHPNKHLFSLCVDVCFRIKVSKKRSIKLLNLVHFSTPSNVFFNDASHVCWILCAKKCLHL